MKKNESTWGDTIRQIKREDIKDVVVTRQKYITAVLNLIENQQKEIDELNELLKEKTMRISFENQDNYISKEKIKAKIEELENEQEKNRQDLYNAIQNLMFSKMDKIADQINVNMIIKDFLKSLLEEE